MFKYLFVVLALLAVSFADPDPKADPKAKPSVILGDVGLPVSYTGYPYGYAGYYPYSGYPYLGGYRYPYYGYPYGYTGYNGYPYVY